MPVFDPAELIGLLQQFMLPFFRLAAFFMVVPIFGNQLVAIRIRILLTLMTTMALFPVLPPVPAFDPISLNAVLLILSQIIIGAAFGFVVQLFFHIFVLAGQMIAMQMGLGFASMIDPTNGVSVAVLSQFYVLLVTLLFLAFNGHLVLIDIVVEGFYLVPIAMVSPNPDSFFLLASAASWMFASAILLALPAVTAILIVNFAFGVMTRAAPQLNVFSLGFPFTLVFGIFILWVSTAGFMPQYQKLSEEVFSLLNQFIATV